MNSAPGGDVMHREANPNPALDGQIMPSPAHIAFRQQAMYEALLPIPRSAVTLHGQGPTLTERAIEGIVEGALRYKSVLLAPLVAAVVNLAGAGIHAAPHAPLVGGMIIAGSAVTGAIGTVASLAHITNPPDPHHVATHTAGHAGKIIATAFGMFLGGFSLGMTTWLGLLSGGSAAGFVLTSLGAGTAWAIRIHESHGHRHIRETDRVRAVAELAAATAQGVQPPFTDGGMTARVDHPIVHQVVWAMAQIGLRGAYADAMPTVLDGRRWTVTVNHPGIGARRVIGRLDDLAAHLQVVNGGLKITRGGNEHQTVWAVNNIPMAELEAPGAHPVIEAGRDQVSIWDPIPIGLDDENGPVAVVLAGTPGIFIAGNPRMGKSNLESAIVCTIVRARDCRLWTIDASQRELPIFDEVADRHVGADIDDATAMLNELLAEIAERGSLLKDARSTELTREIAAEAEIDCIALVIDELHHFTTHSDRKKATAFSALLGKVVALGGAAGVFTVAASQKLQSDVIPSFIRDLIDIKFVLRCETYQQVNTALGEGAHKSCPAHELKRTDKGVGYLKGLPDRDACRVRTHRIGVEERYEIVDQYAEDFVATPPPDGPGGGVGGEDGQEESAATRRSKFYVVPRYPSGDAVAGENYVALWNALDQFPDGFTRNEVGALGILNGRSGVQRPLDNWCRSGYLVQVGVRPGPVGQAAAVWRKATAEEFKAMDEAAG